MSKPTSPDARAIVRLMLTLSSVVMLLLGGLAFAGMLGFPPAFGWLFVVVAVVDFGIAFVAFRN